MALPRDLGNLGDVTGGGNANANFDSGTLFIDSVNNRVGIANTTPDVALRVTGSAGVSGNLTVTGTMIGTANNATNLNGQAASFYTDIPARLGYTPVNRAGDSSMTGSYTTTGQEISIGSGQNEQKRLRFQNANRNVFLYLDGTTFALWDIQNSNVRWSTDASANFAAVGNITAYASDERLKTNIRPVSETPLSDLQKLSGVRFEWRDDTGQTMRGTDVGLIAQEVEKVLPEAIAPAPFDATYKTIKMNQQITALMIEAIKELSGEIVALKAELRKLKGE